MGIRSLTGLQRGPCSKVRSVLLLVSDSLRRRLYQEGSRLDALEVGSIYDT